MVISSGTSRPSSLLAAQFMRQAPSLTECAGVPVVRFKVMIFAIACALVGLQGGLQAPFLRTIEPLTYGPLESLNMVVMNVIGGMNSIVGPLLGTVFLVVLPELLRDYVLMQRIFFGICLIVVMAFLPGGIVELWGQVRRLLLGRKES
jgi:branched-chain amino acid transport system permease protein